MKAHGHQIPLASHIFFEVAGDASILRRVGDLRREIDGIGCSSGNTRGTECDCGFFYFFCVPPKRQLPQFISLSEGNPISSLMRIASFEEIHAGTHECARVCGKDPGARLSSTSWLT